ncbi:MAG: transcriptional regulator [Ornithinimicrobium sp.]
MKQTAQPVFDEVIHAPLRLRICTHLGAVANAEFAALRQDLEVADSVLSKHLKTLSDAGYVKITKARPKAGRPVTWAALTPTGKRALTNHIAALRALVAQAEGEMQAIRPHL